MPTLSEDQLNKGYFDIIGGFPALNSQNRHEEGGYINYAQEVKDYKGQPQLCICCTQLDGTPAYDYGVVLPAREKKRILNEWLDFLKTETKAFKALHFNSHVPQRLFDAACCQEDLVELRFKWGNYKDLSALENLRSLKFLFIGSGAGVQDIGPICKMKSLVVLVVENFKRIEDYSPLAALENLEQLSIRARILQHIAMKDLEFLREMPNLRSFSTGVTTFRKKYTKAELTDLFAALPNLRNSFVNGEFF